MGETEGTLVDVEHTVQDWSAKQGRILTGGGRLNSLYTPQRGFPFSEVCVCYSTCMYTVPMLATAGCGQA